MAELVAEDEGELRVEQVVLALHLPAVDVLRGVVESWLRPLEPAATASLRAQVTKNERRVADLERKFATIIDDGLPAGMRFDLGLDPPAPPRDPSKPPPLPRRRPSKETLR